MKRRRILWKNHGNIHVSSTEAVKQVNIHELLRLKPRKTANNESSACCHTSLRFTWIWLTGRIRQEMLMGEEPEGWQWANFSVPTFVDVFGTALVKSCHSSRLQMFLQRIPSSICDRLVFATVTPRILASRRPKNAQTLVIHWFFFSFLICLRVIPKGIGLEFNLSPSLV